MEVDGIPSIDVSECSFLKQPGLLPPDILKPVESDDEITMSEASLDKEMQLPYYCICGKGDLLKDFMLGCDQHNCKYQWWHFSCAGLEKEKDKDSTDSWTCPECIKIQIALLSAEMKEKMKEDTTNDEHTNTSLQAIAENGEAKVIEFPNETNQSTEDLPDGTNVKDIMVHSEADKNTDIKEWAKLDVEADTSVRRKEDSMRLSIKDLPAGTNVNETVLHSEADKNTDTTEWAVLDVEADTCLRIKEGDGSEMSDSTMEDHEDKPFCVCGRANNNKMVSCDGEMCPYIWWHYKCAGFEHGDDVPKDTWLCTECQVAKDKPSCICGFPNSDKMVACNGQNCSRQWWHYKCAGFENKDLPKDTWLCSQCQVLNFNDNLTAREENHVNGQLFIKEEKDECDQSPSQGQNEQNCDSSKEEYDGQVTEDANSEAAEEMDFDNQEVEPGCADSDFEWEPKTEKCNTLSCDTCLKCFTSVEGLKRHKRTCKQKCIKQNSSKQHESQLIPGLEHYCRICNKGFATLQSRQRHEWSDKKCKMLIERHCNRCGQTFSGISFKDHIKLNQCKQRKRLPRGDGGEKVKGQAKEQIRRNNQNYEEEQDEGKGSSGSYRYVCNICEKGFHHRYRLKNHELRDHAEKSSEVKVSKTSEDCAGAQMQDLNTLFLCSKCGKSCTSRRILRDHEKTHMPVKPHVCDICGKDFTQKNRLREHQLSHTGQQMHVCDVCGKGFTRHFSLKKHMDTHSDIKPFDCKLCDKAFASHTMLKRHLKSHESVKKSYNKARKKPRRRHQDLYQCGICEADFSDYECLTEHQVCHLTDVPCVL